MIRTIPLTLTFMLIFILMTTTSHAKTEMATADSKINFKIVDEDGIPVELADVGVGYIILSWGINNKTFDVKGYSDANGYFTAYANASAKIGFTVKKEGYYRSFGQFEYKEIKDGNWEPRNPELIVVLRKIVNPVPMYARDTTKSDLEIPVIGKEIGFDLVEYDWIAPYGKGKHADLIFKIDKRFANNYDFDTTLTITFLNKFDGIQLFKEDRRKNGSEFKLLRTAPEKGYQHKLVRNIRSSSDKRIENDCSDDDNYFFRIRSKVLNGKLVQAMYGKIQGGICPEPRNSKSARILFAYFLNPDYTRNLEYRPGENLFKDLPSTERVGLE